MNSLPIADIDADVSVHPYGDAGDVGHRINRTFLGRHVEHGVGAGIPNTVGAIFDLSRVTIKPCIAFDEPDAIGGATSEPMPKNKFLVIADLFRELRYLIRLRDSSRHPINGKHHFYICQNGSLKFCRINGENPDKIGVFTGYIFFIAS